MSYSAATRDLANPDALQAVRRYLRDTFRHCTVADRWDPDRREHLFTIRNLRDVPIHAVSFSREFLDCYGQTSFDLIPQLLESWRLLDHLSATPSGVGRVKVDTYGVQIEGM